MRRRRSRRWLWPVVARNRSDRAWPSQARTAAPRALADDPAAVRGLVDRARCRTCRASIRFPAEPRPEVPGDRTCRSRASADGRPPVCRLARRRSRRGLPINLAAALQLAGVQPLDIAAATVEVQQGCGIASGQGLWIPNLNAGVDYARHDGVQQNIFTGGLFQQGRQSFFVGGGPSLNVALTDAIYEPLPPGGWSPRARPTSRPRATTCSLAVSQAYFVLQEARGRLVGVEATIVRAQRLVDLAVGLAPALIAPLEINRAKAELQSLKQTREDRDPRLDGRQRGPGGDSASRSRDLARAGGTPVCSGDVDPGATRRRPSWSRSRSTTGPRSPRSASFWPPPTSG